MSFLAVEHEGDEPSNVSAVGVTIAFRVDSEPMTDTPSAFRALEKAGWETAVGDYDDAFARLTAQSIDPLLDAVAAGPGTRLLDVACGPGYVAAAAASRGVQALGIDFSSTMIALARQRHPSLTFEEGDAEALDVPDASFDAVAMNFGILHLDRPDRAIAEALRVLVPGGRFAFTVWAAPPQTQGYRIVLGAIERAGNAAVALPPGPPFFRYADAGFAVPALETAGFEQVQLRVVPQQWRFSTADGLFDAMLRGTVRTAALLQAQTPEALAEIRLIVVAETTAFADAQGRISIPMPSVLVSGRRPG